MIRIGFRVRHSLAVIAVALFCAMSYQPCDADQFTVLDQVLAPKLPLVNLPIAGGTVQGFTATVQIAQQEIAGYVPVEITIKSTSVFASDRRLVWRFEPPPDGRSPPKNGLVIDVPMQVAQGAKAARAVRYLPKWSAGHAYQFRLFEDTHALVDYEGMVGQAITQHRRQLKSLLGQEYRIDALVIVSGDFATADDVLRHRAYLSAGTVPPFIQSSSVDGGVTCMGQKEYPSDWRGYQRFDIVALTCESLERLQEQEAPFQALRQWVLAGGTLLVQGEATPAEITSQLDFCWTDDPDMRSWVKLVERKKPNGLGDFEIKVGDTKERSPSELEADRVWLQVAGAGIVIGSQENPPRLSSALGHIIRQTIGYRQSPMLRRGVDPLIGDRRFTRWMIPGVAQPPVYAFMGLLTVFVILVGPVAYRRTTRHGRGYLMFAIAPALALVTTLAMFGYGIASDGFGTVTRIRQLTWIDGASGDAGERVRATYFAGVRPRGGLRFPGNAEVIGYPDNDGTSWEELHEKSVSAMGRVTVSGESQLFDGSFLPSRQQKQFVIHQPRPDLGAIDFRAGESIGEGVLHSTLKFALDGVVVRDRAGQYWSVHHLPPGSSTACNPLTPQEASKILGDMYTLHRPISAVREARQRTNYRNDIHDLIVDGNRASTTRQKMIVDGVFEQWLSDFLQLRGELPQRWFVATAKVSGDVIAVENAELVDSVRYVFGTMP